MCARPGDLLSGSVAEKASTIAIIKLNEWKLHFFSANQWLDNIGSGHANKGVIGRNLRIQFGFQLNCLLFLRPVEKDSRRCFCSVYICLWFGEPEMAYHR